MYSALQTFFLMRTIKSEMKGTDIIHLQAARYSYQMQPRYF